MKSLLLLASLFCFGRMPAGAQQEDDQGIKVYWTQGVIYKSNIDGSGEEKVTEGYGPGPFPRSEVRGLYPRWGIVPV